MAETTTYPCCGYFTGTITHIFELKVKFTTVQDSHRATMSEEPALTGPSRCEALIRHLVEGTASQTGHQLFHALVRCAATVIGVAGVRITECFPEHKTLRSLVFWMNDHCIIEDHEYPIAGTPCEQVIEHHCFIHYPERVIEVFPDDPDLVKLSAASYAGLPLLKADGTVLGHFSALDTKPLHLDVNIESVFRNSAARAAADPDRLRSGSAVRKSEQRFSRLFESAMDAIFELDDQFRILRANAAATLFGASMEALVNQNLTGLLIPRGTRDYRSLRNSWACPVDTPDGYPHGVILRNVQQQLAAANRLRELEGEAAESRNEMQGPHRSGEIMGESPAIREVEFAVRRVADYRFHNC